MRQHSRSSSTLPDHSPIISCVPFLLANFLDYLARVADCYSFRWNVSHEYAAGSNHAVVADSHTGTNDTMSPKPDTVPDVYGFRRLQSAAPNLWVNRMEGRVDAPPFKKPCGDGPSKNSFVEMALVRTLPPIIGCRVTRISSY